MNQNSETKNQIQESFQSKRNVAIIKTTLNIKTNNIQKISILSLTIQKFREQSDDKNFQVC